MRALAPRSEVGRASPPCTIPCLPCQGWLLRNAFAGEGLGGPWAPATPACCAQVQRERVRAGRAQAAVLPGRAAGDHQWAWPGPGVGGAPPPPPPPPAAPPGSPRAHAARVKGLWFDASPCVMCRKCMRLYERSLCRTGARAVAASAELCHTLLLFCALHGHALTLRLEVGILKAG